MCVFFMCVYATFFDWFACFKLVKEYEITGFIPPIRRYCTFVPPFFIDDSGAEFHAD